MEDLPEIPDLSFLNREKDCTDHSNHLPGRPCDTWSTKSQTLSSKLKAKVDKLKKGRQNRSAVRSVLPSRQNKNGEVPGDKDVQESRQKDMTDPGGGDDASSSTQDGVVQIEDPTGKGKQMYRNCLGHEFVLDLTEEAKSLAKDLVTQAKSGKPPTTARLKWFTVEALTQLLRYNDRPAFNLGTHAELAATVADYIKNGVPPRCPKCKKGALRFSNGRKRNGKRYYWCPGWSPNGYHIYGCNFKAPRESITRKPFCCPN